MAGSTTLNGKIDKTTQRERERQRDSHKLGKSLEWQQSQRKERKIKGSKCRVDAAALVKIALETQKEVRIALADVEVKKGKQSHGKSWIWERKSLVIRWRKGRNKGY